MVGNWSSFNAEVLIAGARHVIEPGSVAQTTVWVVGNTEPENTENRIPSQNGHME